MHTMEVGTANVPAFLTKLWKLVEDPTYCDLISWSSNGRSFVIKNPTRFSKELLPLFFKHNNMASFIRQLNMYGFRKLTSIENSGLRSERDEMEFYHQYFLKQQENLLEYIKRKASTNNSSGSSSGGHHHHHNSALVANGHNHRHANGDHHGCNGAKVDEVHELLASIMQRQDSQENFRVSVQNEYSTLWKEIAYLRQQNNKQQTIVQRLIQFLMSLVQSQNQRCQNGPPTKRKAALMIDGIDGSSTLPPAAKRLNLEAGPSVSAVTSSSGSSSSALTQSNGSSHQGSHGNGHRSFPDSNHRSEQMIKSGIFDAITSGLSNGPTIHDVTDDVIDTELEAAANSNPTISLPNAADADRPDLPAPLFQDIDLDVLSQVLELTSNQNLRQHQDSGSVAEDDEDCSKDGTDGYSLDPEQLLETVLPIVSQAGHLPPPLVSTLVNGILSDPQVKFSDRAAAASLNHNSKSDSQSVNYWSSYDSLPSVVTSSSGPTVTIPVVTETPDYLIDPSSLLEEKDADLSSVLIPDVSNNNGDNHQPHAAAQTMSHYNLN